MSRPPVPDGLMALPVAHRAFHDKAAGRPENSLEAVRAAVAAGYAIEIDVQPSSDGVAMVFHDDTLDRMTAETGPVRDRSAAALGAIRLNDGPSGIPTLEAVLAEIGGRVPLVIELKDQSGGMGAAATVLEEAVAAALAAYRGPVAVMSFNPQMMAAMARLAPGIARGLTTYPFRREDFGDLPDAEAQARAAHLSAIPDYDRVGASFISHYWKDLALERVAELKAQGARILCWTLLSAGDEAVARGIADNVTFEQYPATLPVP